MIKAYSESRNRCYLHPHRLAEQKCERCKTPLCAECTRDYRGQHLCEHCVEEIELAEAMKPTLASRVRDFFRSVRNTAIVLAVFGLILAGVFLIFRPFLNQPLTPEEFARMRYAVSGSFQTPEGINVNSTVLGAKVVAVTSERPGYDVKHLINEYTGEDYPGWRSATATFPQDVVVEHDQMAPVSKVILYQQAKEPRDTWAKDVEIDVSTEGPDRGFVKVGQWRLEQVAGPQRFTFPPTPSKWIRLRILSNYGSADYTSLDEFDAYVVTQSPYALPTESPTG